MKSFKIFIIILFVTFFAKSSISQCVTSISPTSFSMPGQGGTYGIYVGANACRWYFSPGYSWVHPSTTSEYGTASVTFTIDLNPNATARIASINIEGKILTINQAVYTPPTPIISTPVDYCGYSIISWGTPRPPTGITWYWQTSSNGTSMANSNVDSTVYSSGTYYLRACTSAGIWSTSCASKVVNLKAVPSSFAVSGSATRCSTGAASIITLSGSQSGVNYQLKNGTMLIGSPKSGNGSAITWSVTDAGTYQVEATSTSTGCIATMLGNAIIEVEYPVTGIGTITGLTTVCAGSNGITYSLPVIANATGYSWTLPTGASIASGNNTNSITVRYSSIATSGNITVKGTNSCGDGPLSANFPVTVVQILSSPGAITGSATVCQGQDGVSYTIPAITNATSYVWELPPGASFISSNSTNYIVLLYSSSAQSGDIFVQGANSCGSTSPASFAVTVNPKPSAPTGSINGLTSVCPGQTGVIYSVPAIPYATGYSWTLPSGATITAGNNTRTITVSYSASASSGNITVCGTNNCYNGPVSASYAVLVNGPISAVGTITGTPLACPGESNLAYTVPLIGNATGYDWTLPSGATITAGANTNNITVKMGSSNGNITVKGTNTCYAGAVSPSYGVSLKPNISSAGTISGPATVCQGQGGQVYTATIPNATSYLWELPTGASFLSSNNTSTVALLYSANAVSGGIYVQGQNSCGMGPPATLSVTVNPPYTCCRFHNRCISCLLWPKRRNL